MFRALRIKDQGDRIEISARVRDGDVARYLVGLRPGTWSANQAIGLTTPYNSGDANVESVEVETTARSSRAVVIKAAITWQPDRSGMGFTYRGFSSDERLEQELRATLLGEPLPAELQGFASFGSPAIEDPLAPLADLQLPQAPIEHIGRLLMVEQLVGAGHASSVDEFTLGPDHLGRRHLKLTYSDRSRYADEAATTRRTIEGVWRSDAR